MSKPCKIVVTADGGYMVSGDFEIEWPSGTPVQTRLVAYLCRCGHSKNKPFCDGSHRLAGFKSQEGDETAHRD